jgi:hypothetical protein
MSSIADLLPNLKDELIELCIGDDYEELVMSDNVRKVNGSIFGYCRDIVGDFVVVDCFFVNKRNEVVPGNRVYINSWSIKAITKVKSNGSLNDVFMSSADARKLKAMLGIDE